MAIPASPLGSSLTQFINTGSDISVRLVDNNNTVYNLGKVMEFTSTHERKPITVEPLNSPVPFNYSIPNGEKGTIVVARENGAIDQLQAAIQAPWFAGQPPILFTIYTTVQNMDGTVNSFSFTGCDVWVNGGGQYKKDSDVQLTIDWTAQKWSVLS